jgi:hypothetical protein
MVLDSVRDLGLVLHMEDKALEPELAKDRELEKE